MTPVEQITSLYIGYFGRAPDPEGLNYWVGRLNDGFSLAEIAESFSVQPESTAKYPYLANQNIASPQAFITQVYLNLFNRVPDAEGLEYWTNELANGADVGDFILNVISGATTAPDSTIVANKIEVGVDFALEAANLPGFVYNDAAATAAVEVINGVDATDASVEAAKAETDAFVDGGVFGGTLTLTDATDVLNGTANNDTFLAPDGTLTGFDQVNGGAGTDTLRVAGDQDLSVADLTSIEIVNVEGDAATTYSADDVDGLQQIWFEDNSVDTAVTDLDEGQAVGLRGEAADVEATYEDEVTTASIALDGAEGAVVTVDGADLDTVDLSGSTADGEAITIEEGAAASIETLNIAAEGDLIVDATGLSGLETVTTSGAAGDEVVVDLTGVANDVTFTGGAADDAVVFDTDFDAEDNVDGGAGENTLVIDVADLEEATDENVDNFQTLGLTGSIAAGATVTFDGDDLDVETIAVVGSVVDTGETLVLTDFEGGELELNGTNAGNIIVEGEASTGDEFTVTTATASSVGTLGLPGTPAESLTFDDVESVTFASEDEDADLTVLDMTLTATETLTFTGAGDVDIEGVTDTDDLVTIDLSDLTGSFDNSGAEFNASVSDVTIGNVGDSVIDIAEGEETTFTFGAELDNDVTINGFEEGVSGDLLDIAALGEFDIEYTVGGDAVFSFDDHDGTITLVGVAQGDLLDSNFA